MADLSTHSSAPCKNRMKTSRGSVKFHDVEESSHRQTVLSALKSFSANRLLTDVTIWTETTKVHVHKAVMQCFSARLMEFSEKESCNWCVMVDESYSGHLGSIVDIVYLGAAKVSTGVAQDVCALKKIFRSDQRLTSEPDGDGTTYLVWLDHEDAIFQRLWKLRSDSCKYDLVFVTGNYQKSYAHSCILGACSEYLLNIFLEHFGGGGKPFVFVLENVDCEDLETVLEFCYRGSVRVVDDKVKSVYKVAELLGVRALCTKLSEIDPSVSHGDNPSGISSETLNLVNKFHGGSEGEIRRSKLLQETLSNLFRTESLVDVTFYVRNHKFRAHRVILSAFSKYFRKLSERLELSSSHHVFVLVQELRTHDLEAFLDYIYKGEALYHGTSEEFFASMLDWLDFDLVPMDHRGGAVAAAWKAEDAWSSSPTVADGQEVDVGGTKEVLHIPKDQGNDFIHREPHEQTIESTAKKKLELDKEVKPTSKDSSTDEDEADADDLDEEKLIETWKRTWEESRLTCQTCGTAFETRQRLREHLSVHPEARVVKCRFCAKGFSKPSQMRLHLRTHTGHRPFQCNRCGARFAAKSALTKHAHTHSDKDEGKAFECEVCKKSFSRKEYVEEHLRTHSGSKPYACPLCPKAFVGRTGLNHHVKTHGGVGAQRGAGAVCEVCGKSFSRHALWTHLRSHSKSHACDTCGKRFSTATALRTHVAGTHLGTVRHQCDVCGKGFLHRNHLLRHLKVHDNATSSTASGDFPCDKCHKVFRSQSKLESHSVREHSVPGERPYSCNICNKKFAGRSTVIYHRRAHTGERPHACDVCGKSFARPDALRQHLRSHDSHRQLLHCQVCNTKFSSKGSLSKHALTHKGEPEVATSTITSEACYQCGECDKAFDTEKELSLHAPAHAGTRPHRCNFCRTSFRYVDSLVKHVQIHAGDSLQQQQIPPPSELPGMFAFHVCGSPYGQCEDLACHKGGGDFCDGATTGGLDSRRPFSITVDGNLCCNDGDLPEEAQPPPPPDEMHLTHSITSFVL